MEAKTRALEGFPVTLLPGRGLARRLSVRSLVANAGAVGGFLAAVAMAVRSFARWRPAVVVSLGGYASLPCVVAAVVWRVPVIVVNVDAVPGAVNRWASRVAVACAVSSPDVALPRAVVTGVPVRADMARAQRSPAERREARERLGLPEAARVVAVSGGSLGSRRINQATLELARLWSGRQDVAIRHVVGRRDWEELRSAGAVAARWSTSRCRTRRTWPRCTRPPTSPCSGPGPTRWPNWPWPVCPRSWCRCPGRRATTRVPTLGPWPAPAGPWWWPMTDLDGARLAQELDALFAAA